jgi:hypothetical protein
MAERSRPPPLWALFERLVPELQLAIIDVLGAPARNCLRLACSSARALVNSRVARIALPAEEVVGRPLRLHERFPRLEVLVLSAYTDGALTDSTFPGFATGAPDLADYARTGLQRVAGHGSYGGPAAVLPPAAWPEPGGHRCGCRTTCHVKLPLPCCCSNTSA